jgi:hypothetical protein
MTICIDVHGTQKTQRKINRDKTIPIFLFKNILPGGSENKRNCKKRHIEL